MQLNVVLTLIFAIVIAAFALFNASVVTVSFFFAKVELSLAIVIIASALIGALIIWFFDAFKKLRTNKQMKELNKKNTEFEKKLIQKEAYIKELEEKVSLKEALINELKANETLRARENTPAVETMPNDETAQNNNLENGD
ncbi:LapA family protein [Fusibacter ferrireducens]|uniref:DUF1049 domain-containing protein n=1 Tax=Fusibacter ferrireducens TaxID=2785058 RepID=A0ABR9ZTD3_9FIRM|nr:LapA family protein [Fusibacter ferrireducens]MBF4693744.1 DUF1049 domain-containing protein [Fusibacter ferrireducens]